MMRARSSRILSGLAAAVLIALLFLAMALLSASLRPAGRISGWVLLSLTALLGAYNLRKKLPFLPLLSSRTWMQVHAWTGTLTLVLYLLHAGARVPAGTIERGLALLFLGVAGSGLAGLALTRVLPPRLAVRSEEVLFERIPLFRHRLADDSRGLVLRVAEATGETTLAEFYASRLARYFAAPRHGLLHLVRSERPRRRMFEELAAIDRYLDPREREAAAALVPLISAKNDLDFQHAHQAALKGWLFLHLGLTWSLLLVGLTHGVVAEVFSGSLR